MAVSGSYQAFVLDQLGRVAPVSARRMFGGVGIYSRGRFFALIDDDVLYFKVDEGSRPRYEQAGMEPFRPFGPDGGEMWYYQVPADTLEDVDALGVWMREALDVARRARAGRRRRR